MHISHIFPDIIEENNKFEFTSILNKENPLKWAKTIVAYANCDGGTIFVGVANNGEAFGLSIEEIDKAKSLVYLINDRHIFPHARIRFELRSVDYEASKFVLAIEVLASNSIVRYRDGDFKETVYIKGDGSSIQASPEDIMTLSKRKYGVDNAVSDIKYDSSLWNEYNNLCQEYRNDEQKPSIKELQNEEILTKDELAKSGFLMFKDDYGGDDTLIACRLWNGKDKTGTVLDAGKYKGNIPFVFNSAFSFIERNTKKGWIKTKQGGRKELRAYPKIAIREALVNAIAHRDYSIAGTQIDVDIYIDRIDIVSPGSWLLPNNYYDYPEGTIPSIRRNTIIAACLDVANLMERSGTGFQTMMQEYKNESTSKQPVVMIYPGFLDLRLFDTMYNTAPLINDEISKEDIVIEQLKGGPKKIHELQVVLEYNNRSKLLRDVINPMIEKGIIYRDGKPKSPSAVFKLKI